MKHLFLGLALFGLITPSTLFAQETPLGASLDTSVPSGNVSCFDYYQFGSVQADLEGDLVSTVPGANINFQGKIKNENDYPVVNGTLFVKIFVRNEATFSEGDGNLVVDQFKVEGSFNLPPKGEKAVSFSWHVPENAEGGEYYLATFFTTENRYNLSGLSFTDDVIGNSVQFTVVSQEKSVFLDKTKTTLNGQDHHFAAYPLHFKNGEKVEAKTTLTNPTNQDQVIQLTWEEYTWDGQRVENQKSKKYELVAVKANSSQDLLYTINPQNSSVSYLIVTAKDRYSKSIQGIRLVRDGIEETRINFPSLTSFPIKKGEANALFACAHSTNLTNVPGNTLTLTLRDDNQDVIHTYTYQGDISGAMAGFKDDFTPKKSYDKVFLTATLQRNNQVVEEVTIPYDCSVIDKETCNPIGSLFNTEVTTKKVALLIGALLSLIAILAILITKMKHNKRNSASWRIKVLFFALLLGTSFLGSVGEVEGKSVSWSWNDTNSYYYRWDNQGNTTSGWNLGLRSPSGSIVYSANLYNDATNQFINDGTSVPVGTVIRVTPATHQNADISWFGTGYSSDSPNGYWINNASAPSDMPTPYKSSSCTANDYVGTSQIVYSYQVDNCPSARCSPKYTDFTRSFDVAAYIPLAVHPPTVGVSVTGTATLTSLGGNRWRVDSGGTIVPSVTFSNTYGKYYYRYYDTRNYTNFSFGGIPYPDRSNGCYRDSLETPLSSSSSGSSSYQLAVPQQTIQFNLTAVGGNNIPSQPTLTGPTSGAANTNYTFIAITTDLDNDTLRYGMDWNNDSSVDEWLPAAATLTSGTPQNFIHQWATNNNYTFKVLAQDSNGGNSPWSNPHTITIGGGGGSCTLDVETIINDADGFADMRSASECQANNYLAPAYGGIGRHGNYAPCNGATAGNVSPNGACVSRVVFDPRTGPADRCVVHGHECTSAPTGGVCKWQYVDGSDTTDLWGNVFQSCRLSSIKNLSQCDASLSAASHGTDAPPGPPGACKLSDCEKLRKDGPGCSLSIVEGVCGMADRFPTTNPPTIGLCTSGTPTAPTLGGAPASYSWTCTGSGGGTDMTCGAPYLTPAPVVDLKINGSDGPLTVNKNSNLNITWGNVSNAVSCEGTTGIGWMGLGKSITGGNDNVSASATSLYTLTCTNSQGIQASDTVSVTLATTLKICQGTSCDNNGAAINSLTLHKGNSTQVVACYNTDPGCDDASGQVAATWTGATATVTSSNTNPNTITGVDTSSVRLNASYSGQNTPLDVNVICSDSGACSRDPQSQNLCASDTFTVVDICGVTQNCHGSKSCDYNWKEVAPN